MADINTTDTYYSRNHPRSGIVYTKLGNVTNFHMVEGSDPVNYEFTAEDNKTYSVYESISSRGVVQGLMVAEGDNPMGILYKSSGGSRPINIDENTETPPSNSSSVPLAAPLRESDLGGGRRRNRKSARKTKKVKKVKKTKKARRTHRH